MSTKARKLLAVLAAALVCSGASVFAATKAQTINLPEAAANYAVDDDDAPDETARVARISFIRGEAKIKRVDGTEWENATLNLPIVEGDEIVTDNGSRVEIQFNNYQHIRLAENAYLKIASLNDKGIALSLSLGSLSVRVTSFDKDKSYFEIDAPKTTLAIQKSGTFRIDAGQQGDSEVRVAATDGGEARVYSDSLGFTLKNGRSSRIYIDGTRAGEWETAEASRYMDEFDSWASDRDNVIAKRLRDAYYDKYYDQDIYGADDLNDNGQWVYTRSYGFVWRPFNSSINQYADWSPYRYGHWRWIPPYGWTWVNDEPWGWSTYHYGRWIYDAGYWSWSPYGYYRWSRSWWSPALVVINIFNNNVCWYPLGYHHRYYNYNWNNNHHGGNHHNNNPGGITYPTGGTKPLPTRTPIRKPGDKTDDLPTETTGGTRKPLVDRIPPGGVVAVETGEFGTRTKGTKTPPLSVANAVLQKGTDDSKMPALPSYKELNGRMGREIVAEKPKAVSVASQTKVGAADRKPDLPMDNELREQRVFGGRKPQLGNPDTGTVKPSMGGTVEPRKTGAVERPFIVKEKTDDTPIRETPGYVPRNKVDNAPNNPVERKPRYEPPLRVETPRSDPPPTRQPPRYDPPVRNDTPKEVRRPPLSPPTPKQDPAPTRQPPRTDMPKSEPKQEPKASPKASPKVDDGL
ncbi:hypothetical protein BH10ACI3_BH10ACI3_19330 [soil metagenome]